MIVKPSSSVSCRATYLEAGNTSAPAFSPEQPLNDRVARIVTRHSRIIDSFLIPISIQSCNAGLLKRYVTIDEVEYYR